MSWWVHETGGAATNQKVCGLRVGWIVLASSPSSNLEISRQDILAREAVVVPPRTNQENVSNFESKRSAVKTQ